MKKIINGVIISISIVLIGFVILFSLLPNIVLNVIVTLCGFTIPIFLIITTMIVEIKKSKNMKEKDKIRNFWLKVLFIIYCLLLITVLFLNNEYRMHAFQNINTNTFSKEHFEMSNIIPFATITDYISSLVSNEINTNIVIINFTTNLLLFAPMRFFISILYSDRIKNIKQFAVLMIVSALIVEVLQFITFRGSTDIDDVILNTIGAVIVYLLMKTKFVKKLLKKVIDISE